MKTFPVILLCVASALLSGCMSEETSTRMTAHEFIQELPHRTGSDIRDRVVKWVAGNMRSAQPASEYQDTNTWSIVTNSDAQIKPEGPRVNMRIGFTMSVDVKNEKIRIRFTNLRRVYGSKKYDEPLRDDFFATSIARPYLQAAQMRFNMFVHDLTEFIEHQRGDVATNAEELHASPPASR